MDDRWRKMDAKWWQKLTLPLPRWVTKKGVKLHLPHLYDDLLVTLYNQTWGRLTKWPLYTGDLYMKGFDFSTKYCTLIVNKHFSLHLMFLIMFYLLFCSCRNITLVYIYCWWNYLNMISGFLQALLGIAMAT